MNEQERAERRDGKEGFRAVLLARGDGLLEVRLQVSQADAVVYSQCVWRSRGRAAEDYGELTRSLAMWQAVASYLNATGSIEALSASLAELARDPELPTFQLARGYSLLYTQREPGEVHHVFADLVSGRAFVFIEDVALEPWTLEDLAEYLRHMQETGPELFVGSRNEEGVGAIPDAFSEAPFAEEVSDDALAAAAAY